MAHIRGQHLHSRLLHIGCLPAALDSARCEGLAGVLPHHQRSAVTVHRDALGRAGER